MAEQSTWDTIKKKLDELYKKILVLIVSYIIFQIVALVICYAVYLSVSASPGTFTVGYETFTTNDRLVVEDSMYQGLENTLLGKMVDDVPQNGIRKILYDLRHNLLFNYKFRSLAILVAILATLIMGLSMLTGNQKITIKEFVMDILLIFGSTGLLLSPDVDLYINFFYEIITSASSWIMHLFTKALYDVTSFEYYANTSDPQIYAPLDIVSSIFFDKEVAGRVRQKLIGLMFGDFPIPYIQYVPIVVTCMLYAWLLTVNVFIALLLAKMTILFALQALPFFILFTSVNNVKARFKKKGGSMPGAEGSSKFLSRLIDVGIVKPWVYLTLISSMASLFFYILIVQNIRNLMNFSVYVTHNELSVIKKLPIVGKWLSTVIHTSLPRAKGLQHEQFVTDLLLLILGTIIFKYIFDSLVHMVNSLTFSSEGGKQFTNLFGGDGHDKKQGGLYGVGGKRNTVADLVNPVKEFVKSNALEYTLGFDSETNKFDNSYKSLLGGTVYGIQHMRGKTAKQQVKKIIGNAELSQDKKKTEIIKQLKRSDVYKSEIQKHYGDDSLKVTDKHYQGYAEKLLKNNGSSSDIHQKKPSPSAANQTVQRTDVLGSVEKGLGNVSKSLHNTPPNADESWKVELEKQETDRRKRSVNPTQQDKADDEGTKEIVDAFSFKKK